MNVTEEVCCSLPKTLFAKNKSLTAHAYGSPSATFVLLRDICRLVENQLYEMVHDRPVADGYLLQ